jgi:hypothetical protein
MAGPYYVRSTDGSDASDGLTWANAKATLVGALAVAAAGERIWVSQVHAETQATSMTPISAGTAAAPVEILCGNDAAEPPTALATTATITTTGTSGISFVGFAYIYGITFSAGTGAVNAAINFSATSPWGYTLEQCSLQLLTSGALTHLNIGSGGGTSDDQCLTLINTTIRLAPVAGCRVFVVSSRLLMRGGSFITESTPTIVFSNVQVSVATVRLVGVDLSLWGAGKSLVNAAVACAAVYSFEHCKLGASVALVSGASPGPGGPIVLMDNCDSADTQYRMQLHSYEGDAYSETTIVRTGGASNGNTPLAHKLVSSAGRKFHTPLYGPELVVWNNTTGGAKTITVEIIHDSVTPLTDAEVWLEVGYLGTSGFPLALFAHDRAADILATPANQTSSSVAWTTTGITNVNKQKLAVTVTPQETGIFRCRVALAKASYTVYVDPLLAVS